MRPILSPAEATRLDQETDVPVKTLMERAGLAVALEAVRLGAGYGDRVAVLAGPGNNGGDGYVAARHLRRRGAAVTVHALAEPNTEAASKAAAAAIDAGVPVLPLSEGSGSPDLVVDAIFGGGFRNGVPEAVKQWLEVPSPVVSVDFPTGLDPATGEVSELAFTAVATVTFHAMKSGHILGSGPERCGRITVADIGLVGGRPDLLLVEDGDAPRPPRARTAHKWSAGSVLVVGGSLGMVGAAILAARSALRFGAGAVAVACPAGLQGVIASNTPELLTRGLGIGEHFTAEMAPEAVAAAQRFDVVALGPGLGADKGFARSFAERWSKPLVLDADGLNAIDLDLLSARPAPTVITPHAGEFRRLTGADPGWQAAGKLAEVTGAVVVLKGSPTFVASSQTWVACSGGPELASIGTGDVLTGMVAALWARRLDPETAARSAVHWHGRAGAAVAARTSLTADRLSEEIGRWAW